MRRPLKPTASSNQQFLAFSPKPWRFAAIVRANRGIRFGEGRRD
uniref:Uncharacterized protein n=1 Tax=Rhizophora mucronata TaxID=61149 RepID=A0A2P2R4S4_RHIMU